MNMDPHPLSIQTEDHSWLLLKGAVYLSSEIMIGNGMLAAATSYQGTTWKFAPAGNGEMVLQNHL